MLLTKKKVFKLSAVALVLCGAFSQSLASTSGNVTIQSGDATLETIDASAQYGDLSIVNGGGWALLITLMIPQFMPTL